MCWSSTPTRRVESADRVDYIYYRGPYRVGGAVMRAGRLGASNHPYVSCELVRLDQQPDVIVPDVLAKPRQQAIADLAAVGLQATVNDSSDSSARVSDQTPLAGARVSVGTRVVLRLSTIPYAVLIPDVVEVSASEASRLIRDAGLNLRTMGPNGPDTWVASQSAKPRSLSAPGSTVTIVLREADQL